ncbi:MAG: hypothetical protein ACYS67_05070 [Planctomycetota bacterium]|jgi:hypothetical protein
MRNKDRFEILAAKARGETPPRVNVAGRVIANLTAEQDRLDRITEKPLMWVAVFSSAAAIPAAVLAIVAYYNWVDPLFEISQAIAWVMQ